MASGSAIMGNHMSRSYAVWDNGWRPLKPETHLEIDGWWYVLRQDNLHSRNAIVITQCRRRCIKEGTVSVGVELFHDSLRFSLICTGYYNVLLCYKAICYVVVWSHTPTQQWPYLGAIWLLVTKRWPMSRGLMATYNHNVAMSGDLWLEGGYLWLRGGSMSRDLWLLITIRWLCLRTYGYLWLEGGYLWLGDGHVWGLMATCG